MRVGFVTGKRSYVAPLGCSVSGVVAGVEWLYDD